MKKFIVQKFGGTSVGFVDRLGSLKQIVQKFSEEYTPIVVVSAVSGISKQEGTTSLLLGAIDKACRSEDFDENIKSIRAQHLKLVELLPSDAKDRFANILEVELQSLVSFLSALSIIKEQSSKSLDFILSFGERLSALLVTEILKTTGLVVKFCDLSNILSDDVLDESENFYDSVSDLIVKKISPVENEISVVTGFFGYVNSGILNKVGRGYSDLTSALIARGLGPDLVHELQIWKEVDGVYSADPRKIPSAKVLNEISAKEAVELTFFGSEVIHPHTMEQVISKNIPIRVLNSLKPDLMGTIIRRDVREVKNSPIAVTSKKKVIVLSVVSNRMYDANGFLAQLFEILREEGLVVDLVSTSEVTVSCTVNDIAKLNRAYPKLSRLGEIRILENRAILAVVGTSLSQGNDSVSKMFAALSAAKIYPEMVTQAESMTSISFVVEESVIETALVEVHGALFAG